MQVEYYKHKRIKGTNRISVTIRLETADPDEIAVLESDLEMFGRNFSLLPTDEVASRIKGEKQLSQLINIKENPFKNPGLDTISKALLTTDPLAYLETYGYFEL